MKIVIVGYGEMFTSLIAGLINTKHEIVGVFRQENIIFASWSRLLHDFLFPSADRIFTKTLGLYDIKAKSVNSKKFRDEIKRLEADIIITGSWGEKFSNETIKSPKLACINTHPALLPKYRGPNPYFYTILNGEEKSGVTFHLMSDKFDEGDILHQWSININNEETGLSLKLKCCETVRKEVSILINSIEEKLKTAIKQNNTEASYYPQITLKDCILDFKNETSVQISRRIRALTPWLNCHIPYKDEFFEIGSYKICDFSSGKAPSTIIKKTNKSLFIVCSDSKVMEFSNLKLKRPLLSPFTSLYIKYFVDV